MLHVQVSVNQLDEVWGVNAAGEVFYREDSGRWKMIRTNVVMSSVSAGPLPGKKDMI